MCHLYDVGGYESNQRPWQAASLSQGGEGSESADFTYFKRCGHEAGARDDAAGLCLVGGRRSDFLFMTHEARCT